MESTPLDLFNGPVDDHISTNIVLGIPLSYCSGTLDKRALTLSPHLTFLFKTIGYTGACPPISLLRDNAPYHDRLPGTFSSAGTHTIYSLNVGTPAMVIAACSLQSPLARTLHPALILSPYDVMYIAPGGRHSFLADPDGAPLDISRRNYTTLIQEALKAETTIHDILIQQPLLDDIALAAKVKQDNWTRRKEQRDAQQSNKRFSPQGQHARQGKRKKPIPIIFS
eukprot:gene23809-9372_t